MKDLPMTFPRPPSFRTGRTAGTLLRAALSASLLAVATWHGGALAQAASQPVATTSAPAAAVPVTGAGPTGAAAVRPPSADGGNPYGLRSVWNEGDLVGRGTLVLLALMSLGSWYIILAKLLEQRRQNGQAMAARAAFAGAGSVKQGADKLAKGSPFHFIVDSALTALHKHPSLASQVDMADWLSQDIVRNVGTLQMRMQNGLALLSTVGSTAPFVGLFGTVWGIYNALVTIGVTGQASIDKVAGPVGEALIMTALGLAVAVPAVLGYNWLVRHNRQAMHAIKGFGSDLHTLMLQEVEHGRGQRSAG
jgi:biopolymer transport protein ExbB